MANQAFIKNLNERRVLSLLRVEQRLTRADIARRLNLMRSTVTNLVDGLVERELVNELEQSSAPKGPRQDLGRPGIDVALNPIGSYFIGAEIGVDVLRLVLVDMSLQVIKSSRLALKPGTSPDKAIARIAEFLEKCRTFIGHADRIAAVSVTVPGLVRNDGFIVHLPILGWKDINFLELATQRMGLPVLIENNANAAAFGEAYCHPKASKDVLIFLKLGNGCGGAAIINGRLLRGTAGTAAEFGHMRVSGSELPCNCGARGCLEPLVNLDALQRYQKHSRAAVTPHLQEFAQAAAAGRGPEQAALSMYASALATGLVNLTNLFNPSDIVLGGVMRPVLELILAPLREQLARGIVPGMQVPTVQVSRNGVFECAIGAAALAHQQAFDEASVGLA